MSKKTFHDQGPAYDTFLAEMRRLCTYLIDANGNNWAAEQLGISIKGVEALLWKDEWSAHRTLLIAERLKVFSAESANKIEESDFVEHPLLGQV